MATTAPPDRLIVRGVLLPTGVARDGTGHALHVLINALYVPETPAGQHRHLRCGLTSRLVERRGRGMTRAFSCGADRMAAPANETTPRIAAAAKTGEDVARRRFELRITRDMFRSDLAEVNA